MQLTLDFEQDTRFDKTLSSEITRQVAFIYHNADNDGKMAAFIARVMFQEEVGIDVINSTNTAVNLIGYNYGTNSEIDTWLSDEESNKYDLYIFVDITPPIDWLQKVSGNKDIIIFDHHEQAYKNITNKFLPVDYIYKSNMCGAELFYYNRKEIQKYFIPSNTNPFDSHKYNFEYLLELIGDYDLWKFDSHTYDPLKRDYVLALNEYLRLNGSSEQFYTYMMEEIYCNNFTFLHDGNILIKKIISETKYNISKGKPITIDSIDGYIINGYPNYWCRELLREKGDYKFFIGYQIDTEKSIIKCSIRELDRKFNVLKIANKYGGGGHKAAAGFSISLTDFIKLIF